MKLLRKEKGFTLIELLLVVVIIGLMLAVIVPRAWRANIDTKYGLVRQNCAELASFGQEWAETQINAQPDTVDCPMIAYLMTLAGSAAGASVAQTWIANTANNWTGALWPAKGLAPVTPGGWGGYDSRPTAPECVVANTIPPEKLPRNPFNGATYFVSANLPSGTTVIPGAIACAVHNETGTSWHYYAFLYQGTDSTTGGTAVNTSYYAGQDPTSVAGLRNGVFFARVR